MFDKITNLVLILACCYVGYAVSNLKTSTPEGAKPRPVELVDPPTWRELSTNHSKKIAIIVSDYECPYCAKVIDSDFFVAVKTAADKGKVRLAVSDYPLPMHGSAKKAAEMARCSQDFANMDGLLHASYDKLPKFMAGISEMDPKIAACVSSGIYAKAVEAERSGWQKLGVNSTPTILLGELDPKGKLTGNLFKEPPSPSETERWMK